MPNSPTQRRLPVVFCFRLRDVALAALLGNNYSEARPCPRSSRHDSPLTHTPPQAVIVRDPIDRALSGYYFITMSRRRTDAVNAVRTSLHVRCNAQRFTCQPLLQAACGFNLTFAGRHFDGERMSDRLAFATHGYAVCLVSLP